VGGWRRCGPSRRAGSTSRRACIGFPVSSVAAVAFPVFLALFGFWRCFSAPFRGGGRAGHSASISGVWFTLYAPFDRGR